MEAWNSVFLGLIALALVVQTVIAVRLAMAGQRVVERLDALETRLQQDLKQPLEQLVRVAASLEVVTEAAVRQIPQVEAAIADTVRSVHRVASILDFTALTALGPVGKGVAVFRAVRRAYQVYQGRSPRALPASRHDA
jgi:hypothetical protein